MHSHSRRGFLARMLGGAWATASLLERAALVAARARAQSKEALPVLFDIEKVAEGTYAAVARGRALINSNDNWRESQQAEIEATGLAPQDDLESAVLVTVATDAYTAIVVGKDGGTGVALVEVYRLP